MWTALVGQIRFCGTVIVSLVVALSGVTAGESPSPTDVSKLEQGFRRPPDDSRPMMRWWWFGPAVTKSELAREMQFMKAGGIGGFEVQPVYPLAPDDQTKGIRNLPYLSKDFLDALRFTSAEAHRLGLRMDLTLGSGWPYGGARVPIDEAAPRLRWERVPTTNDTRRVPVPALANGESLIAAFAGGTSRELTDIKDGVLWLPQGSEKPGEVWFFILSRTGQMVKRAAYGAEGYVLNHYERPAVDHYLNNVAEPMLKALGSRPPYAVFCDSLEVYGSDWSSDLLDQFRQRRGYDLRPHLPALVSEAGPETAALRHDWGQTLTELLDERFLAPMQQWAKAHRTLFRAQVYGTPPATVSSYVHADLIEGENSQWRQLTPTRWASSASHLLGHRITSSETWTWLHSPVFRATPLDMKAEADRHFLVGINQLVGHGWPYTAEGVEYPGWRFYAAGVYNEKNPWWIAMPDVTRYLQRLSFLLRQGKPANDVALYLPTDDAWAHLTNGNVNLIETLRNRLGTNVIGQILDAGYGFDFFDDAALERAGGAEKGALAMGDTHYRAVVLPGVETIPASTLRKLAKFAHDGGILVATRRRPETAPGLRAADADKVEVNETAHSLFETSSSPARLVADETQLGATLAGLLTPDMSLSPPVPDIGFIHRRTDSAEVYFLANTGNLPRQTKATFRVGDLNPEWWDPMTGDVEPAVVAQRGTGTISVALELEPYASRVLVFSPRAPQSKPVPPAATPLATLDLSTNWQVTFGDKAAPVPMDALRSWTNDESTRYYSGSATYEKTVVVPANLLRAGVRVKLDFGEGKPSESVSLASGTPGMSALLDPPVREAAVVTVNGRRVRSIWCPPYSLDVTGFLKEGPNKLQIVVGNLALNYMAGHSLPDYKLLNIRYGERFQAQDMNKVQPIPAGLLGPIRLIATEAARSP